MKIFSPIRNPLVRLVLHYLIWELCYMLTGLPIILSSPVRSWDNFFFTYGVMGTLNFLLFCLIAFYLIPILLIRKRRVALLVVLCILAAALFTLLKYKTEIWNFNMRLEKAKTIMINGEKNTMFPLRPPIFLAYFLTYIWFSFIIIIIAFAYQLLLLWYRQDKLRKELENQKLQAELSFLKMQVNPHFLFNALNNIYSMAIIERSKKTSDGILKLSELVRYMLYEKEDDQFRVSLNKEIKHINSFIDLQKLRYDGDIYIHFSIEGNTENKRIPSLLLFPLIENSCKHGILQDAAKPVNIQLKVLDHQLNFSIHNFKNRYLKDETGGIGLTNVRKRLALLYPGTHAFSIHDDKDDFLVELQLPL